MFLSMHCALIFVTLDELLAHEACHLRNSKATTLRLDTLRTIDPFEYNAGRVCLSVISII